ncbi:putative membrane protein [Selenomonas ruminantium subsp. lactilytica TAM6421]|uniref:Putative membrane protein n=1 Tax=Selenomonas ruminantium subsp. lactilytica (strain NBRC 103574 / TAM6421) TaxID=927704 RepID=I0GUF7_SELRL|nr:EpsG family protein [Selenomonas ruminantium]BAL84394.1 putative membrane protein [Selenomonas ruminantium subsp. lactilytica TAM6421]
MRIEDILLLSVLVLSFSAMWLDVSDIGKINKKIILLFIMMYSLYVGYIYFPITPDFWGYKSTYYDYTSGTFDFEDVQDGILDYGFLWICELVKSMGGSFEAFYLVVCAIALFCCYSCLLKYTPYVFSAWFLWFARTFYENNVNQIRQGLAICIFLFALRYVIERKLLQFTIIVIIASLIHKTMIITFLIYPLGDVKWDIKKIALFIGLCVVLYILNIYQYMIVFMTDYLGIGVAKMDQYSGSLEHMASESASYLIYRSILVLSLVLYLLKWNNIKYNNLHISMLLMSFFTMLIFSELSIFSSRLSAVFSSSFCFALPEIYRDAKCLSRKMIFVLIIIGVGITFFLKNHFLSAI